MPLSDCIDCWDTPCVCGTEYKHWSIERLEAQIKMLQGVIDKKKQEKEY
jgi:hypothetical protein